MIRSFKNRDNRNFYQGKRVLRWQLIQAQAERRMQILDEATCINDLRNLPSNHFEMLSGERKEQYSIRINKQWRICFQWIDGELYEVEIVDYH